MHAGAYSDGPFDRAEAGPGETDHQTLERNAERVEEEGSCCFHPSIRAASDVLFPRSNLRCDVLDWDWAGRHHHASGDSAALPLHYSARRPCRHDPCFVLSLHCCVDGSAKRRTMHARRHPATRTAMARLRSSVDGNDPSTTTRKTETTRRSLAGHTRGTVDGGSPGRQGWLGAFRRWTCHSWDARRNLHTRRTRCQPEGDDGRTTSGTHARARPGPVPDVVDPARCSCGCRFFDSDHHIWAGIATTTKECAEVPAMWAEEERPGCHHHRHRFLLAPRPTCGFASL
mmetsp:Transcript_7666/g.22493  ORF Transcript_7666/g.22493 Transcript_7666/m.22493 type:complete len:286 (-) Transcript_7666:1134-1991(-)